MPLCARCECTQKLRELAERNRVRALRNGLSTKRLRLSRAGRGWPAPGLFGRSDFLTPARNSFVRRPGRFSLSGKCQGCTPQRVNSVTSMLAAEICGSAGAHAFHAGISIASSLICTILRGAGPSACDSLGGGAPRVRASLQPRCSIADRDSKADLEEKTPLPSLPCLSQLQKQVTTGRPPPAVGCSQMIRIETSKRVDRVPTFGPQC